jgi:hypothetical protein
MPIFDRMEDFQKYWLFIYESSYNSDIIIHISIKGEIRLNSKEMEQQIIQNYQRDEQMMILVFAQWCVNRNLSPSEIYLRAYPNQAKNNALQQAIDLTVPKEESEEIADTTLLNVLSLFGNEDLAFIVTEEINKNKKK